MQHYDVSWRKKDLDTSFANFCALDLGRSYYVKDREISFLIVT